MSGGEVEMDGGDGERETFSSRGGRREGRKDKGGGWKVGAAPAQC